MRPMFALAAAAAAALAVLAAPGAARASCSGHCYGEIDYYPSAVTGALAAIATSRLSEPTPAQRFATSEMWVCDWSAYVACNTWVESGQLVGIGLTGSATGRRWFWEERPGTGCGNPSIHTGGFPYAPDGTRRTVKVSYNGGGKWAVYLGGSFVGNSSVCHAATSNNIALGTETTDSAASVRGNANTFQKRSTGGTWSYGWPGTGRTQVTPAWATWQPDGSLSYGSN